MRTEPTASTLFQIEGDSALYHESGRIFTRKPANGITTDLLWEFVPCDKESWVSALLPAHLIEAFVYGDSVDLTDSCEEISHSKGTFTITEHVGYTLVTISDNVYGGCFSLVLGTLNNHWGVFIPPHAYQVIGETL